MPRPLAAAAPAAVAFTTLLLFTLLPLMPLVDGDDDATTAISIASQRTGKSVKRQAAPPYRSIIDAHIVPTIPLPPSPSLAISSSPPPPLRPRQRNAAVSSSLQHQQQYSMLQQHKFATNRRHPTVAALRKQRVSAKSMRPPMTTTVGDVVPLDGQVNGNGRCAAATNNAGIDADVR